MSEKDAIRGRVSDYYGKAVTRPRTDACCGGPRRSSSQPVPKGAVVQSAGYDADELATLPADAVENAFGCGNPLALAEVGRGDVVLDLGSGAGIDIIIAGRKVGPQGRVIGIDMTDEMIARARSNVAAAGLANVEVRKGLIEDLPVDDGSIDLVISNCVIVLSPDKPVVFAEIARVLKPGGRMQVSDLVVESLPQWVRASQALYNACVAGAIGEAEYIDGLHRAGLVDVEVRERLVYDASQIVGLIRSELAGAEDAAVEGRDPAAAGDAQKIAQSIAGKVWSAKFFARKPGL